MIESMCRFVKFFEEFNQLDEKTRISVLKDNVFEMCLVTASVFYDAKAQNISLSGQNFHVSLFATTEPHLIAFIRTVSASFSSTDCHFCVRVTLIYHLHYCYRFVIKNFHPLSWPFLGAILVMAARGEKGGVAGSGEVGGLSLNKYRILFWKSRSGEDSPQILLMRISGQIRIY